MRTETRKPLSPPLPLSDLVCTKVENYRYYRERIETIICRAISANRVRYGKRGKADRGHDKSLITSARSDIFPVFVEIIPVTVIIASIRKRGSYARFYVKNIRLRKKKVDHTFPT